jgi:hypothetical protein
MPESKLSPYRSKIAEFRDQMLSYSEIVQRLRDEDALDVSESQLKRQCRQWQITTSYVDLEPYRTQILHWYIELRYSRQQILTVLSNIGVPEISSRTLERHINQKWGVRKQVSLDSTQIPMVKGRIMVLFFQNAYSDDQILAELRTSGFSISLRQLKRVRLDLGLVRRKSEEAWKHEEETMRTLITNELQKGVTDSFGRGLLHTHFRGEGYTISR